jgi:hypothetical protein
VANYVLHPEYGSQTIAFAAALNEFARVGFRFLWDTNVEGVE